MKSWLLARLDVFACSVAVSLAVVGILWFWGFIQ